jgi:phosphate transport system permease protein
MTMTTTTAPGAAPPPLRPARPRRGERVIEGSLLLAALVSIATTIAIIIAIFEPAVEFFLEPEISLTAFLTGTTWTPLFAADQAQFGVLPLVAATFTTSWIALAVAIPLGLGAAIYLAEYASPRVRKTVKPTLEILAGIPTVVYGYFALTFFTPVLLAPIFGDSIGTFNMLSAGLIMGVMIIPIVASLSEDAISAVPQNLREGAYGMGSTKMQVATRVVVPAAVSGIFAAFMLAISRAVGETMIVALAAGKRSNFTFNPLEDGWTMTGFIVDAAQGDQPTGTIGYESLFAVAALLFVITFVLNMISIRLVRRFREEYE